MLFCDTASASPDAFDDLAILVDQLNAAGIPARLRTDTLPLKVGRYSQYDVARYLTEAVPGPGDRLLLTGAHEITDAKLAQMRRIGDGEEVHTIAFGRFPTRQSMLGTIAKLAYVLGKDPKVVALSEEGVAQAERCPVFGVDVPRAPRRNGKPTLLLVGPDLSDASHARALQSIAVSRSLEVAVLTNGKGKQDWINAHGTEIPIFHFGECLPSSLAARADICAYFSGLTRNYRAMALLANLVARGVVLIDSSAGHKHAAISDAFIRGPLDIATLGTQVAVEVVPHLEEIGAEIRESEHARAISLGTALASLDIVALGNSATAGAGTGDTPTATKLPNSAAGDDAPARVVFVPTNGVGLGHAQRCSLVASALDSSRVKPVFAAFGSCMKMLNSYGFDTMPLVSRSPLHGEAHDNDIVNYPRLSRIIEGARSLVFDGGYVFDSIYRSVLENRTNGIWIRRGLWQATQDNSIALDREKIFNRVIVPTEAFDELNQSYSHGDHVRKVGPIVQRMDIDEAARREIRERLQQRLGIAFEKLCVTMLGGGIAADRRAQTAAMCGLMEHREDTLNLVVVWPTATVEAGWFSWNRTRVVKTHHASTLVAAADLYVSAAGYNSFHEAMYNRAPTIFIPQMSRIMDDQQARAQAAAERQLATLIQPTEIQSLGREIDEHLDGGKSEDVRAALAGLVLPEPGNAQAARIIEEMSQ